MAGLMKRIASSVFFCGCVVFGLWAHASQKSKKKYNIRFELQIECGACSICAFSFFRDLEQEKEKAKVDVDGVCVCMWEQRVDAMYRRRLFVYSMKCVNRFDIFDIFYFNRTLNLKAFVKSPDTRQRIQTNLPLCTAPQYFAPLLYMDLQNGYGSEYSQSIITQKSLYK